MVARLARVFVEGHSSRINSARALDVHSRRCHAGTSAARRTTRIPRTRHSTPASRIRGDVVGVDGARLREGDRVVFFDVHRTCGRCYACAVSGTPTKCVSRKVYGITDSAEDGLFGGWREAIYLEPGVVAAILPAPVTAEDYIGGGCGLITAVHAIDRASLRSGDPRPRAGHRCSRAELLIALARLSGASTVIAIGTPGDRLTLATRMGATLALDLGYTSADIRRAAVLEATSGRGVPRRDRSVGLARARSRRDSRWSVMAGGM